MQPHTPIQLHGMIRFLKWFDCFNLLFVVSSGIREFWTWIASCMRNESTARNPLGSDSTLNAYNEDDAETCLQRQSLFAHMTEELCLAIRCHGSQQRAAFKRKCSKCRQIRKRFNQEAIQNAKLMAPSQVSTTASTQLPHQSSAQPVFEMKEYHTYENSI